jgi:outer membrane receptor protein involved in Fe transport
MSDSLIRGNGGPGQLYPSTLARAVGAAVALMLTNPVLAQQQNPSDKQSPQVLPTIDVVGTSPLPGLGIDRNQLPYNVQTGSDQDLRQSQSANLTEYMSHNLTGVNVNEIQGSPFQNDVTFRGFRASPILGASQGISVYLDGVRVNEPFGDVVNWDMLPEAAIANVTLVPGSNPVYGLNTLGGALAFTTKSGLTHPGFEVEISAGSFGRKRLDLAYGAKYDQGWHAFIAGTAFDENGWREHSAGRLGNIFAKFGRDLGTTKWDLSVLGGSSKLIGNGLLPSQRFVDGELRNGLYEDNRKAVFTHPDQTKNRFTQLTFNGQHWLDNNTELSATAYIRKSRRDTVNGDIGEAYGDYAENCEAGFNPDGSPVDPGECGFTRAQGAALDTAAFNTTQTRQDSYGVSVNLTRQLEKHHLTLGATLDKSRINYSQFEQDGEFTADRGVIADPTEAPELSAAVKGSSLAFGVYAADTWNILPDTYLTASARFNHARVSNTLTTENGPQPQETFNYNKLNPAIGVTHKVGAGLTLFGNVSQSNRVPTVIELGCADPNQPCRLPAGLQSDPFLEQVVSRTVEAGARWQPASDVSLAASVYRTINRDDIIFLTAGRTQLGYFDNFDRTRHQGVDLSASKHFGNVALRLNYSYLEATYDTEGTLFTGARNVRVGPGTRMAGLPRHTLKLGLDWKATPQVTLGGDMVALSSLVSQGNEDGLREDPEPGEAAQRADLGVRGHALFHLRGSYRPSKQLEFFARINNVFDRRYETYGAVAQDLFPNGRLIQPHVSPEDVGVARFVAPGAPRSFLVGMRYSF